MNHPIELFLRFRQVMPSRRLCLYMNSLVCRKQEVAFGHFQLACYQRDLCLRFLDLVDKEIKQKNEDKYRQKAKWYGSLAEKNWQRALEFYGPNTHPTMFLNILMAQSVLSVNLSDSLHSSVILEAALVRLLEGRHVVEPNEEDSNDVNLDIKPKFLGQLLSLLKSVLAAAQADHRQRQLLSVRPTPATTEETL
ncbi:hypothetical protein GUJ93_ZPchr0007g4044 [Zizania palustris]|uniref:Uncharacterized protein n=1 Tax=Zizania palustris TaxID=103762 RepID=A0A8J5TIX4_ZIZPA|nr:hypothetical protein GUJ93_ZPchr0007g4044 [Zizania palustris]